MITVTKELNFEACHMLGNYDGECANLHGHSYKIRVTLSGENIDNGMIMDFKQLKSIINLIIPDHRYIFNKNDIIQKNIADFLIKNNKKVVAYEFETTAENMVIYFAKKIQELINTQLKSNLIVTKVTLWETEKNYAEWVI